jgi:DNA-directed RNA polymerase subunit L
MYRDSEGQIHVLLALDRDGGDGILIDSQGHDYARYTAFMPNIKAYIEEQISIAAEQIIKEAAEQIIKEAAENSSNGSWAIYYDEIEENQGLIVKENNGIGTMLLDILHRREEIAEIEIEDECFDITLYLDYCINLDEEIKQGQNMKM